MFLSFRLTTNGTYDSDQMRLMMRRLKANYWSTGPQARWVYRTCHSRQFLEEAKVRWSEPGLDPHPGFPPLDSPLRCFPLLLEQRAYNPTLLCRYLIDSLQIIVRAVVQFDVLVPITLGMHDQELDPNRRSFQRCHRTRKLHFMEQQTNHGNLHICRSPDMVTGVVLLRCSNMRLSEIKLPWPLSSRESHEAVASLRDIEVKGLNSTLRYIYAKEDVGTQGIRGNDAIAILELQRSSSSRKNNIALWRLRML
ncbi:hypothetical protein F4776DRAFT_386208 [Hypoxylon sp. NC0597]|nr:hypothetical protein F4776DRAFT_386208 [Hypoxylon sp. NC0597]